jgi:hypothetical protein
MKITNEFIKLGASDRGGWNKHQLEVLGVPWPPTEGWKDRIIGTEISDEDAKEFLYLRGMTKKQRNARDPNQLSLF